MPDIIAVASGKGGVGKSFFAANVALSFKARGDDVLLVDCDLGCANLHNFIFFKIPKYGLNSFLYNKVSLKDVIVKTEYGVDFIGGADSVLGMPHIKTFEKQKLIKNLRNSDYKYVIIDLGAGTSYNMLDIFNESDRKIIITSSEPTSIENAYSFLKISLYRKIERYLSKDLRMLKLCKSLRNKQQGFGNMKELMCNIFNLSKEHYSKINKMLNYNDLGIVLNMLRDKNELNFFILFSDVVKKYLSIKIEKLGFLPYDINVGKILRKQLPYYICASNAEYKTCFDDIRNNILNLRGM